jgi:hypothetical protein
VILATADSLQILARARAHEWAEYHDRWHDFFLLSGTAAVTLAGLLFVAISLHLETLIHATREHLLALARVTLLSFVIVMVISLMMLVPVQSLRETAVELMLFGGVPAAVTLRMLRVGRGVDHADFRHSLFQRRLIIPLLGYAALGATGALLLFTRDPYNFPFVIGPICMMLGNAAGTSWDLLVRTARIRQRAAAESREA